MFNKNFFKRLGLHALFLLVLYILQSFVFPRVPILGVKPVIIPVAVIGIGFFGGAVWGGVFGLFSGILCDIIYLSTPLFTLVMPIFGLLSALLSEFALLRGISSYLLCSLTGLLIISFLQMFTLLIFDGASPTVLMKVALLQTAYSLLFVFPLYYPVRLLSRQRH